MYKQLWYAYTTKLDMLIRYSRFMVFNALRTIWKVSRKQYVGMFVWPTKFIIVRCMYSLYTIAFIFCFFCFVGLE